MKIEETVSEEKIAPPQKPPPNSSIEIIPVIYEIIRRFVYFGFVLFFKLYNINFDISFFTKE